MQQSTRIGNVRLKFLPSDRTSYVPSLALKAACMTAGLVTAFAIGTDNSASAQVITSQGNEIFDLSLVETVQNLPTTSPITGSRTISDAPAGTKGIAVLTEYSTNLIGQNFKDLYGVDEDLVLSYLVDGNTADKASYDTFLGSLPESFIINSTYSSSGADHFPNYFVLFSAGQNIGSPNLPITNYPQDTHFAGFGVALEPAAITPEPGALLPWLVGSLGLAGQRLLWQRRKRTFKAK